MKRRIPGAAALLVMLAALPAAAGSSHAPLGAQSFHGETVVKASPAQVWSVLTDARKLTGLLGYDYHAGTKAFDHVGAAARVTVWGEDGNFVLVRARDGRELRFSLDPAGGSYICACAWSLEPVEGGTRVRFTERYTESGPQTAEALQQQKREVGERMESLRRMFAER